MSETKRRDTRVKAVLPLNMQGRVAGVTKDVSASGVFFETDHDMADGSPIEFAMEIDGPSGKMVLRCSGQVVRVDRSGTKVGVAVKILESKLELKNETNQAGAARQGGIEKTTAVSR